MSGFQKGLATFSLPRISLRERGFAPILLVVLLLLGIAAGTLLVQNRTNFLPKAQQSASECTPEEVENCTLEGAKGCKISRGFHYCYDNEGIACIGKTLYLTGGASTEECGLDLTYRNCGLFNFGSSLEKRLYACVTDKNYNNWRAHVANEFSVKGKTVPGGCTPDIYKTKCGGKGDCYTNSNGNSVCLNQTECTDIETSNCQSLKDKSGNPLKCQILGGEPKCINQTACIQGDINKCGGQDKCKIVSRIRDNTNETVTISECKSECNDGWWNYCAIVYKKGCNTDSQGVPICEGPMAPRSVAQKPAPAAPGGGAAAPATGGAPAGGAAAPAANKAGAAATATTSCTDSNQKVWPPTKYYKCENKVCPGGEIGVPFVCENGKWTTPNNAGECIPKSECTPAFPEISSSSRIGAGTAPTSAITNTNCGTVDGLAIPCFKIGVFDEATLQATIADAKVASANYALYRQILGDLQKYVDTSTANTKTAAAQTQADACINQTTSTPATATTPKTTNSSTNSPTNATTSSDNDEPTCTNPTGCCRTFRPGKREGFPNDTCRSPQGYVYKTRPGEITTNGVKKKICELDGDPIPKDASKPNELCRENPWKK